MYYFVHNQYSKFVANAYNIKKSTSTKTRTLSTHAPMYCRTLCLFR